MAFNPLLITVTTQSSTKIIISCDKKTYNALEKIEDELKFVFISSDVEIAESSSSKLDIEVTNFDQKKCIRCWNKCSSVGLYVEDPEICSRCYTNVYGDGEIRKFV